MKHLSIALLILFTFLNANAQQRSNSKLKNELIALEKQSWDAWKARDGEFYQKFLSDDHVEVGSDGTSKKSEIVSFVGSPVCTIKSYSVDQFSLTLIGPKTALLTYHAEQDSTCHGRAVPSPAWVSSLYVKRAGRWQNVLYQQSTK
jgi:hypothetical protein